MVGNPGSGTGAHADVTLAAKYGFIEVYSMDTEYLMGVATLVNVEDGLRFELQRDLAHS